MPSMPSVGPTSTPKGVPTRRSRCGPQRSCWPATLASADGLVAGAVGVAPASNLSLATTNAAGAAMTVRWRLDEAAVRRDVLAANGTTSATRAVLSAPATVAVHYFRPDGTELLPAVTTAAQLASCSARVHVDLRVGTVAESADVALRTRVIPGSC